MNRRKAQAGFTVLEMAIVLAISLVIAGIALPNMIGVISSSRQRTIMMTVSGIIQQCRSQAVNQNKTMSVFRTTSGSQIIYFVKDASLSSPTPATSDPQIPVGNNVKYLSVPPGGVGKPTALTNTQMWDSTTAAVDTNGVVSFNSRGLPCVYSGGLCTTGATGFVLYFNYLPPFGSDRWAAMSVSPAGRVKAWYWNGSAWSN